MRLRPTKSLIAIATLAAGVSAVAYAQSSTMPSPYRPGEIITIDTYGNQVLIVSCGMKNNVSQCGVRQGRNGDFGNGEGDMWVMDIVNKERAYRAAAGLPPRTTGTARPSSAPSPASPPPAGPAAQASPTPDAGGRCAPGTPYVGAIPAARAASPALFQQVIANKFTSDGTPRYPRRVQFHSFSVGPVVNNSVSMTAQGATRLTNGAPAGAQMTTIRTSFSVCRAEYSGTSRYDSTYFCWKAGGEWACGVSESKVTTER